MFDFFLTYRSLVQSGSSVSVEFLLGPAGTGQPSVQYPKLDFKPSILYALGSPIGIFLSARGVNNIGEDFTLPTCPRVFNIFHPVSVMGTPSYLIIK